MPSVAVPIQFSLYEAFQVVSASSHPLFPPCPKVNIRHRPIGGGALDQASAAALQHTGGGQVTDTEVGDEEGYYEVEVARDDGTQVDVQLDRGFNVVGGEIDEE